MYLFLIIIARLKKNNDRNTKCGELFPCVKDSSLEDMLSTMLPKLAKPKISLALVEKQAELWMILMLCFRFCSIDNIKAYNHKTPGFAEQLPFLMSPTELRGISECDMFYHGDFSQTPCMGGESRWLFCLPKESV